MAENFDHHLMMRHENLKGMGLSDNFSLSDIIAVAIMDGQTRDLMIAFDHITDRLDSSENNLLESVLVLAEKLKLHDVDRSRDSSSLTLNDYVKMSLVNCELTLGDGRMNVICSRHLTITFEPLFNCSIYVDTNYGIELFRNINLNKLNIVLRLMCLSKGINAFRFPVKGAQNLNSRQLCFSVFEKFMECIKDDCTIYNEQLVYMSSKSGFYLNRWGQYGVNVIAALMIIITDYLYDEMLYDRKLLSLTLQDKLLLISNIQFISARPTIEKHQNAGRRYQFHLVLKLPVAPIVANVNKQKNTKLSKKAKDSKPSLQDLIERLPTEIKRLCIGENNSFNGGICSCNTIRCLQHKHSSKCKQRTSLLNDRVNILFPISSRVIHNQEGREFREFYIVMTMTMQNSRSFVEYNAKDSFLAEKKYLASEVVIMDRIHFQGNVYNLNEPTLHSLDITDDRWNSEHWCSVNYSNSTKNDFFDRSNSFRDILSECSHHNEFIPEISNAKQHYLLFD